VSTCYFVPFEHLGKNSSQIVPVVGMVFTGETITLQDAIQMKAVKDNVLSTDPVDLTVSNEADPKPNEAELNPNKAASAFSLTGPQ
jgi:hypothetical protein